MPERRSSMQNSVMVLGDKESFLMRVLINKSNDAEIDSKFVNWNVNDINANWENTSLVTLYMDDGDRPHEDVMHFLIDKLEESDIKVIMIGEKTDTQFLCDRFPNDLVYKIFARPVNYEEYITTIQDMFQKAAQGEFKKSILIVDDDTNYLMLVREWLKDTYKVSMANSGLQAIKWLGKNKADLILLDHEMPVTSGPQVLEMLRSDEETKKIPVMFLTGKGDKESVMKVLALKPEGYFLKTIQKTELLEKLGQFFILSK